MFAKPAAATWFHSNQYDAKSECEHCGGIIRHERWCITCAPRVQYAYEVVLDPEKLSDADRINLHALGVAWEMNGCTGACQRS
ncbi:MAG: hypothetical protein WAN03_10885 [Candidatus Sulfotelmatobacter sp.]